MYWEFMLKWFPLKNSWVVLEHHVAVLLANHVSVFYMGSTIHDWLRAQPCGAPIPRKYFSFPLVGWAAAAQEFNVGYLTFKFLAFLLFVCFFFPPKSIWLLYLDYPQLIYLKHLSVKVEVYFLFWILFSTLFLAGFVLDNEDRSVTRSDLYFKELFSRCGLHVYKSKVNHFLFHTEY